MQIHYRGNSKSNRIEYKVLLIKNIQMHALDQKFNRCSLDQFDVIIRIASPNAPTPLKCKNEYLVLPLVWETTVQTVVGSIVWAFRRLKLPRCREMSARGYALYSVCPELPFFPSSS